MTQPQLSVRERAREMFEQKFVNLVDVTGFNDEYTRYAHRPTKKQREIMNFIDQIITLAQEEKIKEVEKEASLFYGTCEHCFEGEDPHRCGNCCKCGVSFLDRKNKVMFVESVIKILKQ